MIDKIAAAIVFIVSFVMVTALIAFMNLQYNNIFEFDFTPTQHAIEIKTKSQIEELKAELRPVIEKNVVDSLKVVGFDSTSIINTNKKVVLLEDSISVLQKQISQLSRETKSLEETNTAFEKQKDSESEYNEWVTTTSKLYESMESTKAAKIILKYSDNIAKDILYSMKKKKAAEILAEINPEIAKRITRVP
jgi:flagellar motility protein MotE (MotC chaperone)